MALLSDLAGGASDANRPSLSLEFRHAQCIATDDPRLRKNSVPLGRPTHANPRYAARFKAARPWTYTPG